MTTARRTVLSTVLTTGLMAGAGLWGAGANIALAQPKPWSGRRVVLGQSLPLTGAASGISLPFAAGAKLYVDTFNARKVSPGWYFELRQLDDGYDPVKAAANAQKMLTEGADILFGFVGTANSDVGAEVARQNAALFFGPFAASDTLRDAAHAHVFHVRPSMADEAFKMVRHCATLGYHRMAVVAEDDAMGRAGLAAVVQALAELKLPPLVVSVTVPVNSDKVDAAVATVAAAQPHAILQVSLLNTTAAFIRKMRKTGYTGTFLNFSVVGIDPLFAALGKDIGGVVVSQVVPSPRSSATPIVKEYLAALDNSDQSPSYESLEGYIAAKTLTEAIRRAGNNWDTTRLHKTMTAMNNYDIGGFHINLRAGVRDSVRTIDLVTITSDGKVLR